MIFVRLAGELLKLRLNVQIVTQFSIGPACTKRRSIGVLNVATNLINMNFVLVDGFPFSKKN